MVGTMNNNEDVVGDLLEKILFDSEHLEILKDTINKVSIGQLVPKELWKLIVEKRAQLMEEVIIFVKFQRKQTIDRISTTVPTDTEHKLKEKDEKLEEVGIRINRIYQKLLEKMESTSQ